MARITDRTVLIVGASSGIGAEVARQLAHGGNRFVITARRTAELAAERVGGDGLPKPFQISQERAARYVVRALEKEPAQAYFPWPTAALVRTLPALPTPVSAAVLRRPASVG
ncbi:SDR family NAD(P)-dependent oxidoreductase [Streptomyces sp. NPDC059629]|uniref:SDR family NAD(P)-dependent oxidoreductase n=1 Tax=Streptomyces sp. NPDC059629 TaxID=3346889 RepID=UPI0036CE583E